MDATLFPTQQFAQYPLYNESELASLQHQQQVQGGRYGDAGFSAVTPSMMASNGAMLSVGHGYYGVEPVEGLHHSRTSTSKMHTPFTHNTYPLPHDPLPNPGFGEPYLPEPPIPGFQTGPDAASLIALPGYLYGYAGSSAQSLNERWHQAWSNQQSAADNQGNRFSRHQKPMAAEMFAISSMSTPPMFSTGIQRNKLSHWCTVCKIYCTSSEILKQHLTGKKHKRRLEMGTSNLEKQVKKLDAKLPVTGGNNQGTIQEGGNKVGNLAESNHKRKRTKDRDTTPANGISGDKAEEKVLSFERCEVCNIYCTSKAILETHFAGKKHASNVRLQSTAPPSNRNSDKAAEKPILLERCEICNIFCTSKAILQTHFAGKKHAARMKQLIVPIE